MDFFFDDIQIDDLKLAVKLFHESRAGFLQLFNNSPVCMSMTTTNLGQRVYVRVNNKFLEIFGFEESEILGRTSTEVGILDAEESQKVKELISTKGRLQNDYVKCIAKDGSIVHTISSIEKMEINGETLLVSFFVDVTRIFEQQKTIEEHSRQLEELNRELEAFSYSVSHDLRAPLRAIDGFTKTLEDDYSSLFDDEGKRMLQTVQRNAQKMGTLIDALLAFSRLGRRVLSKTEIDMVTIVHEVLIDLKKTMDHKAVVKIGTLHLVRGDYALIKQVLTHLLSNGLKFSSKKENPEVTITSHERENEIVYTVSDNGEGFDMRYVDKLFGVFQRLHSNEQYEGTGVGLAISNRIVTKHGGVIRAEAEPGKGATFTFTLPK